MRKQHSNIVRHFILIFFMGALMPGFAFAQNNADPVQLPVLEAPETLEEAKDETLQVADKILGIFPGIITDIWRTQVTPVWKTMWKWTKEDIWQERVQAMVQGLIDKGKILLGREVEKRAPHIEQELEEEKQELAQDIARHGESAGKGLWERFLDLFRGE